MTDDRNNDDSKKIGLVEKSRRGAETLTSASKELASTVQERTQGVRDRVADLSPGQKVAAAAAAAGALAVVTGALAALIRRRHSEGKRSVLHLEKATEGEGWRLGLKGEAEAEATFATKEEGLAAARELAGKDAPSELVVHREDGTVQDRHRYG